METLTIEKEDLELLATRVLERLEGIVVSGAHIVALSGDLGAGKTTFVQTLGRQLGVTETITSPTFTIMRGYETTHPLFKTLIHMDAYRIEDVSELGPLHFSELCATRGTLLCVEWAEKIAEALNTVALTLTLTVASESARTVQISEDFVHRPEI